ncbi:hypothetical protein NZK35_16695, partial [Stieleria sp. ICT_E10.1]|uniref:hypothetical protein n=1 Tax=Stieleria sedimenti TaxID=2976331 RepID=UPI00217FE63C
MHRLNRDDGSFSSGVSASNDPHRVIDYEGDITRPLARKEGVVEMLRDVTHGGHSWQNGGGHRVGAMDLKSKTNSTR